MMETTIRKALLVLLVSFSFCLSAQHQDFQSRLGLDASGDLADDFGWTAKLQQRWRYNSSVTDRTLLQGGVSYSPLSYLKVGVGYRGSFVYRQTSSTVYKQRMHADLVLDHSLDRFKFVYRSRLQYGFDDFQTFSFVGGQAFTWRHRLGVKYHPFGWALRPQVSAEVFYKLNTDDERGLKGVRYIVGAEYLLSHQMSLSLDYILNQELNEADPFSENIISVGFAYSF